MNKTITVQELDNLQKSSEAIQLVDVRSPGEYAAGHVPGAMNIPLEQIETRFPDMSKGKVAVLCQSGTRAGMACDILKERHDGLLLVTGGTQAWIDAGLSVVASAPSRWSMERQVRLVAGLMVLIGTVLASFGFSAWIYLAMFAGAGLTFAGLTNICGMAILLGKLPWNRASAACLTSPDNSK
jgi:rhodanese-related sulfurtransferase